MECSICFEPNARFRVGVNRDTRWQVEPFLEVAQLSRPTHGLLQANLCFGLEM